MPNIKSAIKRTRSVKNKALKNSMIRTSYKTAVKAFNNAVDENNLDQAKIDFKYAVKKIDIAKNNKVISKNSASRKISTIAKKLNTISK